jgi:uncharacterized protein (DUF488 family)
MTLKALSTIGYEGISLDAFIATLKAAKVTLLLDVRELPISRRRGFSKTALSEALSRAGIGYQHERALGAPREVRHRLREDGDLERYFVDFREYLASQRRLLDELAGSLSGCVTLLCYERNAAECHRSVVVNALARRAKLGFSHLSVPHDAERTPARPHPRQSVSAAE